MKYYFAPILIFTLLLLHVGCQPSVTADPFVINARLSPGINIGNALEAPTEGAWGVTIDDDYFSIIKSAGFNSVRIPIRWSAHSEIESPYTISPEFLTRVEHVVDLALAEKLMVIINMQNYDEIFTQPEDHKDRLLGIWKQISTHFKKYPNTLIFEPLNEPHFELTPELWNEFIPEAIKIIRVENPDRTIIIDTADWGGIWKMEKLILPEDDRNIVVSIHYYEPYKFTHQGAEWQPGSDAWLGTTWSETENQLADMSAQFDKIEQWADSLNRPVSIDEFGAYSRVDLDSRIAWTRNVVKQCKIHGFSWAYWEFCSGFGAYDTESGEWRQEILESLIHN